MAKCKISGKQLGKLLGKQPRKRYRKRYRKRRRRGTQKQTMHDSESSSINKKSGNCSSTVGNNESNGLQLPPNPERPSSVMPSDLHQRPNPSHPLLSSIQNDSDLPLQNLRPADGHNESNDSTLPTDTLFHTNPTFHEMRSITKRATRDARKEAEDASHYKNGLIKILKELGIKQCEIDWMMAAYKEQRSVKRACRTILGDRKVNAAQTIFRS